LKLVFFAIFLPWLAGTARGCALYRTDSIFYDASRHSKGFWEIKIDVLIRVESKALHDFG
jgi:hypothetical protein